MTSEFAIGVHALVFLSQKGETVSSDTLAENICTNPARVRKVMARLKEAGLVKTKEGAEGGYRLVRDAARVTLRQVSDALKSRMVAVAWKPGSKEKACLMASGMAELLDGIYDELDELCRLRLENIAIEDIKSKIFGKK